MNFNVNRRNKSLISQTKIREKRQQKSIKKIPQNSSGESLLHEARELYYSQTNLDQAICLLQQYLKQHPKHNEALYLSAVSLLHLGRAQQAIEKLGNIGEQYENKPNAMLLAAMALNKLGNLNKSLQTVNECIKKYDAFQEAICFRGKLYISLNYYHKAQADFKNIINHSSKPSFLCYVGLADCYRFQGKPDKAINAYYKAFDLINVKQNSRDLPHRQQIEMKVAICLYQLQRYRQSHAVLEQLAKTETMKSSELFYYMGQCQIKQGIKQKGLLNLQYSLRLQTNKKIAKKAYKKLIQIYLQNYQFYEALNIVKLGDISKIDLQHWKKSVQSFMLIIKGQYDEGVKNLATILELTKSTEQNKRTFKIKRDSSDDKSRRDTRYHQQNMDYTKKIVLSSPNKNRDNYYSRDKITKKLGYFSTKSVLRAVPKIQSTRINSNPFYSFKKEDHSKLKTQYHQVESICEQKERSPFTSKEKQFILPLILLFKAYGQFFLNNFMKCLDTYQEYETFLKDMFGRESDVSYNKTLCQALLMGESDMTDDSLIKFSNCVDIYYEKYQIVPSEPLLYKIMLLIRLAILKEAEGDLSKTDAPFSQILHSTLQMIDNYKPAIGNHWIAHYFRALIYILLDRLEESRQALEKTFKVTQECSWKLLYVKGVVEMLLGNYYDAVKEFSAGLILENRAQFYLGRSISFLKLSEKEEKQCSDASIQMLMKSVHISSELSGKKDSRSDRTNGNKSDLLIENCFEDLQKYIQIENNQEEISLWVSKILFVNKAYDEAIRSLTKISNQTEQVLNMIQCIEIYEGQFQNGGTVGAVIKSAFDGKFMDEKDQGRILNEKILKNYNQPQFGYLTSDFQKWLVVLHLYSKENYPLLIKYLQKQIFSCEDDLNQLLLRYNVAIIYYLMGQYTKGHNVFKGLLKYQQKFEIKRHINKLIQAQFEEDECLQELKQEIGISCAKLLSNYLPYKPISISNHRSINTRIYIRILIPFPLFQNPSLRLDITSQFILGQMSPNLIQKKIEAPWIKKSKNKNIQFTQKLQESGIGLDNIGNTKSMKGGEISVEEDQL